MKKTLLMVPVLFALGACGSDNPADPLAGFEPQVNNATDSFQLQATDVTEVGTILQYTWDNTGSQASIDHSTTTSAGSASVLIRDSEGTTVYDHSLSPSLNEDSAAGATGSWTIVVTLADYSGTLNFRVQKK